MIRSLRLPLAALVLAGSLSAPVALALPAAAAPASVTATATAAVPTEFSSVHLTTTGDPRVLDAAGHQYTTDFTCLAPRGWQHVDQGGPENSDIAIAPDKSAGTYCVGQAMTMPTFDSWVRWQTEKGTNSGWTVTHRDSSDGVRVVVMTKGDVTMTHVYKYNGKAVLSLTVHYPTADAAAWASYPAERSIAFDAAKPAPKPTADAKPTAKPTSEKPDAKPSATKSPAADAKTPQAKPTRGVEAKTGSEDDPIPALPGAAALGGLALAGLAGVRRAKR